MARMSPPSTVEISAPAKINLTLRVLGRRPDGYHLLDSLVGFADLHDRLTLSLRPLGNSGNGDLLVTSGPFAPALESLDPAENLINRAIGLLRAATGWDAHLDVRLEKYIPAAAGLGGGSADAAATLIAANRLAGNPLSLDQLRELGAGLGADVPACIDSQTCRMAGIGERLTPSPAPPACGLLLVNPGVAVPTGRVFMALKGRYSAAEMPDPHWYNLSGFGDFLVREGSNDLTAPAIELAEIICETRSQLQVLPNLIYQQMSGSGATCFGLFQDTAAAVLAGETLARVRPDWWSHAGRLQQWGAGRTGG